MQQNLTEKKISNDEYENLISKSITLKDKKEKSIVEGKIIAIENDVVIVDVGLKSEGRIPLTEFSRPGQKSEVKVGENLKVFISKTNHQIIDNYIKSDDKLDIADHNIYENNLLHIEDVYIVNSDKVYNNGYNNENR